MGALIPKKEESDTLPAWQAPSADADERPRAGGYTRRLAWLGVFLVSMTVWGLIVFCVLLMFCSD